ncbi:hypothetical protein [Kribbella sp. NPDC051137]
MPALAGPASGVGEVLRPFQWQELEFAQMFGTASREDAGKCVGNLMIG